MTTEPIKMPLKDSYHGECDCELGNKRMVLKTGELRLRRRAHRHLAWPVGNLWQAYHHVIHPMLLNIYI